MRTGDLHLSIHLGPRWTAAVVTIDGRAWPVTFDGHTRIPSGVHLDPQSGAALLGPAGLTGAVPLADRSVAVWDGNYYAWELEQHLGLAPHGGIRAGFLHYNDASDAERLLVLLAREVRR